MLSENIEKELRGEINMNMGLKLRLFSSKLELKGKKNPTVYLNLFSNIIHIGIGSS